MTKPLHKRARSEEWAFDMPAGRATHVPSGLVLLLVPDPPGQAPPGWRLVGQCALPRGVTDRRPPGQIAPGDANAPEVGQWVILAQENALQAALSALERRHGAQGQAVLGRVCREAGERWVFKARLERGWSSGQRAV